MEDIETILNTLIYDGKVERSVIAGAGGSGDADHVNIYKAISPLVKTSGLMRTPCGVCPVSWFFITIYMAVRKCLFLEKVCVKGIKSNVGII